MHYSFFNSVVVDKYQKNPDASISYGIIDPTENYSLLTQVTFYVEWRADVLLVNTWSFVLTR